MKKKPRPPVYLKDLKEDYTGPIGLENTQNWSLWITGDEWEHVGWFEALKAIDVRDDTAPFLALLKTVVPPLIFPHIRDLFERKPPTKRQHGPAATPSYVRSRADVLLEFSASSVRYLVKEKGMPVKDAVERVARKHGHDPFRLADFMSGKRGSTRRMKKRRTAPIKPPSGR